MLRRSVWKNRSPLLKSIFIVQEKCFEALESFIKSIFIVQEECFEALESIAEKVNARDADMRSHIILSMFKVDMIRYTIYMYDIHCIY